MIQRLSVTNSTNIEWIVYVAEKQRLQVKFHHGGVYRYLDVPKEIAQAFLDSESKGSFLHQHIKGHFAYRKIR